MRRKNAETVEVKNPSKGLLTRVPPDMDSNVAGQFITAAKNVRAETGALSSAPGYERLVTLPTNLDSPANLIFQADITAIAREVKKAAIIGTESKIYTVSRRSRPLVCGVTGTGCRVQFAYVADTGQVRAETLAVSELIRSWNPSFLQHGGDMIYKLESNPDLDVTKDIYEECLCRYYYYFMGGYVGPYGIGPQENKFFPAASNHEWTDCHFARYYELFTTPEQERYYTYRRGPVQIIVLSTYGPSTGATGQYAGLGEPDVTASSAMAAWMRSVIDSSDAIYKIVINPFPPYSSFEYVDPNRTLSQRWDYTGVDLVLTGDAHLYERCLKDGIYYITVGTGGATQVHAGAPIDESQIIIEDTFGACRITADYTSMLVEFRDTDDNLRDSISIPAKVSSSICYIGDLAKQPKELRINPPEAIVEEGQSWQFRATLLFEDGSNEEVTVASTWSTASAGIAKVSDKGLIQGVSEGTTDVIAEYSGLTATAQISVIGDCTRTPVEWILAFELSDSLNAMSANVSRLGRLKHAVKMFIDSIDSTRDTIGLVTFSGDFATQSENGLVAHSLTDDFQSLKDVVDSFTAGGDTGVADGLEKALAEFTGPNHNPKVRERMLVLFVDNPADVTNPGGDPSTLYAARTAAMAAAATQIAAIKEADICITVVALDVERAYSDIYQSWATPGYFYPAFRADEDLDTIYGGLGNRICNFGCDYYYAVNSICGPDSNPSLNYNSFLLWNVSGVVDLIGQCNDGHQLFDLVPGNGLYVDMAGSSGWGELTTKSTLHITAGHNYRFTLRVAGNQRQNYLHSLLAAVVSTEGAAVFSTFITPPDFKAPFADYVYNFTADADADVNLLVKMEAPPDDAVDADTGDALWNAVGLLLDRVKFTDVDTGTPNFDDDFDDEL